MFPQTPQSSRKRNSLCAANSHVQQQQQQSDCYTRLSKRRQISSPFISHNACVICLETGLQLVQLGFCGHAVCRSCMASSLLHAVKLQQLPLRCPLPHCRALLQLQPAVQLLEQQVPGSSALAGKVLLAAASELSLIPHHLYCPCPYADCQVPLEFPDDPLPDVPLDCPSCHRAVCSSCRSKWHSGLACAQHQSLLLNRRTRAASSKQQQQGQQQGQLFGTGVLTRSTAAAAAGAGAVSAAAAAGTGAQAQAATEAAATTRSCPDCLPSWLHDAQRAQQQGQWQQQQQQQQQQAMQHQGVAGAEPDGQQPGCVADAMMWSPVKGL